MISETAIELANKIEGQIRAVDLTPGKSTVRRKPLAEETQTASPHTA